MHKFFILVCGILLATMSFVGCKSNDGNEGMGGTPYDPNQPIKFTEFQPDSGGIRMRFIIKGSNFGNDKDKVKVFFKDSEGYERQAVVLGLNNDVIYTIVPKQSDGRSTIRVNIEGKDAEVVNPDKKFRYTVATSVSTVVGRQKEGAATVNGTLSETKFASPRFLTMDNEENILIMDNTTLRLVALKSNKSITIYNNNGSFEQPFTMDKEGKKSFWLNSATGNPLFLFDAETSWTAEPYGKPLDAGAYFGGPLIDPIDSTYVIYRKNTGALFVQPLKQGIRPDKGIQIGTLFSGGSNCSMRYNPIDKYVYASLHTPNGIYRFKLKTSPEGHPVLDGDIEKYIANGAGSKDGLISEAQFRAPRGMAIDDEGNLYIADTSNHSIRKVNIKTGIVSTIAGKNGSAGYLDGDPIKEALFNQPYGIFFDRRDGSIYIGDSGNFCIRKLAIE